MRNDEGKTSLRADIVVDKTDPQIRRRGLLDSLMARAVLTAAYAEHFGYGNIVLGARDIVRVIGILQSADAKGEVPEVKSILGLDFDELRETAANPRAEIGLDPYFPGSDTDLMTAYLNLLRTDTRSVELAYCEAPDSAQNRQMQLILNRLSSAAYILMLECRSERA